MLKLKKIIIRYFVYYIITLISRIPSQGWHCILQVKQLLGLFLIVICTMKPQYQLISYSCVNLWYNNESCFVFRHEKCPRAMVTGIFAEIFGNFLYFNDFESCKTKRAIFRVK